MTQPDIPPAPDFTPVPSTTQRHDGWTPDRQRRFLQALLALGGVAAAVRAVGMSSQSAYTLRKRPGAESFAAAWDLALAMGRDRAFERAVERGLHGYTRPIRYAGRIIGERHVVDSRLLFAACYGHAMPRPDKA